MGCYPSDILRQDRMGILQLILEATLRQAPTGAVDSCKLLFERGAGKRLLNVQSKSGSTALHMASEQKKIDVCTLLLEVGAGSSPATRVTNRVCIALPPFTACA